MKTAIFGTIFSLVVSTSAQFTEFPLCAYPCSETAVKNSECSLYDYKCLCESPAFGAAFSTCVVASCSKADAQATHNFAAKNCALYGITIPSHVLASAVLETGTATVPTASGTTVVTTATVTAPAATATTTGSTGGTGTSLGTGASADAVKMVGSEFAAAAVIAAALFVL